MSSTDRGLDRLRRRRSGSIALAVLGLAGACALPDGLSGTGAAREVDPQTLIGLTAHQASTLLGEPELRRQEAPAEVWQYRTESCVLYLYRDGDDRKVVYTEARHRSRGQLDAGRCVGQIVADSRSGRRTG